VFIFKGNKGMNQKQNDTKPRIYVASLSDYNAGRLLGRWIDANLSVEKLHADIREMLAESKELPAEEWAIHDYEGFGGLHLCEHASMEDIADLAKGIEEYGPVFVELTKHLGGLSGLAEARKYMEEGYRGEYESIGDYVEELLEDCYGDVLKALPDFIRYHIDRDGIASDMEMGGDIFIIEVGRAAHVFDANP
jgi:antirestriction protein